MGTAYGFAVYFARDASYSFRYAGGGEVVVVRCTLPGSWLETIVKDVLTSSSLTQKTKTRSQSYTIR